MGSTLAWHRERLSLQHLQHLPLVERIGCVQNNCASVDGCCLHHRCHPLSSIIIPRHGSEIFRDKPSPPSATIASLALAVLGVLQSFKSCEECKSLVEVDIEG